MQMKSEDILGGKAFDVYFDEVGNLFSRPEGSRFKMHHKKMNTRRPLWAYVSLNPGADVFVKIQIAKIVSTAV